MSVSSDTPIGRVLPRLKGVKRSGNGWVARCPAHDDRHQSLGIDVDNSNVMLKCHTGCDNDAVVAAMGLTMKDLFAAPKEQQKPKQQNSSVTLAELSAVKKLPVEFLVSLGWKDTRWFSRPCIRIPYTRRGGEVHRTRRRHAIVAKEGSAWDDDGEGMIPYEPDGGERARRDGYVVIVEGETDTATLLYCDIPALGMPSSGAFNTLEAHHLDGLKCAFVVNEPSEKAAAKKSAEQFVAGIQARAKELGFTGPVHELRMPNGAKDPNALFSRDPEKFPELFHQALHEASKPPPEPLDDVWKTLGQWGSLLSPPPPRRWLLERPDHECNGARNVGVFPLGKVGMLISSGGVGKTQTLVQLALSVATGRTWFEHFVIPNPGPVVLALGEEDEEEIHRRVYVSAHSMRLTDQQLELAAQNIIAVPLAGHSVALVEDDGKNNTTQTSMLANLRRRLGAAPDWRLIILDPLSRFAGVDTERDNAAATRFIEAAESLCRSPGRPSVLIAHHTSKQSRTEGSAANSANARGASGLTDGARWAAELQRVGDESVTFEVTKSNYAPFGPPIDLLRDPDHNGYLRIMRPQEVRDRHEAKLERIATDLTEKQQARRTDLREKVIQAVANHPGLKSGNDVFKLLKGNRRAVMEAVHDLRIEGWIEHTPEGFRLTERSGLNE